MAAQEKPLLTDLPLVNEAIERAVAPFARLLSPAQLSEMREVLADYIVTGPSTVASGPWVLEYEPLARRVVDRYLRKYPLRARRDDLESLVRVRLVELFRAYRPQEGVPFEGFAWKRLCGTVIDALRAESRDQAKMRRVVSETEGEGESGGEITLDLRDTGSACSNALTTPPRPTSTETRTSR